MKKILIAVAVALLAVGCNTTKKYVVEGSVSGLNGEVLLVDMNMADTLAMTNSVDGTFRLEAKSETPMFATLMLDNEPVLPVFLDGSPIKVEGDFAELKDVAASGTPANEAYAEFNAKQWELIAPLMSGEASEEETVKLYAEMQQYIDENYKANQNNLWGVYLFVSSRFIEYTPEEILEVVNGYPEEYREIEEVKAIINYAEEALRTEVGQPYMDITLPNVEGEEVSLKSVVESNKLVLLDFWASWCRPCMGELPYLVRAYEEFHDKGFEIYGVSLDENAEAWKSAIEKNGMKWVNVSNVTGWDTPAARTYAVTSIPANFLIDSEGKIVAKNLRGEQVMEAIAGACK